MVATYPFHSPPISVWPCLPWHSSMIGHIPLGVHYPPASMGIDIVPSALRTCSFQGLQPHHITCGLHPSSVDALVDVHGWSCNFPFFHPREALLVGCRVTALLLSSCGVLFLSSLTEVVLHGVGLVHLSHVWWLPIHKGMPISDAMRRSWFQWRTHDLPCWFITSYEGTSAAIWCTTSQVSSSHLSLIFLFPFQASAFTSTRLPGFKFTVPIFLLYYCFCLHASAIDWACASCRAVLNLSHTEATYTSTCLAEASLVGASLLHMVGKTKSTRNLGCHPNIK